MSSVVVQAAERSDLRGGHRERRSYLHQSQVDDEIAVTPSGAAACSSTTVPPVEVLDHPQRRRARRSWRRSGTSASARRRAAAARHQLGGRSCRRGSTAPGPTGRSAPMYFSAGSIGPGLARPSPVIGKTPCRKRGLLFTRVLLSGTGCGARGRWTAGGVVGWGWGRRRAARSFRRPVDAGDGDRADLEGGHPADGVERRVGERVGAGAAAPVERGEDDVGPDRVGDVRVEPGAGRGGWSARRRRPAPMPSRRARSGCSSARGVGATIDRLRCGGSGCPTGTGPSPGRW